MLTRVDLTGVIRTQVVSNAALQVDPRGGIVDVHLVDNPALQVHSRRGVTHHGHSVFDNRISRSPL